MGFQGDVAGIGLGELLQGLARGGREGELTLRGGGRTASVGLRGGQLLLLPGPDENPELWRDRAAQAWVLDMTERIDSVHMREIAAAARMETMFGLLDSEGVHFRFEPGSLPVPESGGEAPAEGANRSSPRLGPAAAGAIHCPPISVEFLLLEYARLNDESASVGSLGSISGYDIPRVQDANNPPDGMERFWEQCDGMSSVREIADRLSWPQRRCQATVLQLVAQQKLRMADGRELLVLAQAELAAGRVARAGSRLSGWIRYSKPGLTATGDVELLLSEWEAGNLLPLLGTMEPRFARAFLRRLDAIQGDWLASLGRWQELRKRHLHDVITEWREMACRVRCENESVAPQVSGLLRMARSLQEADRPWRAGVILRVAALCQPDATNLRLELGMRLLACGLVEDGGPWIVDASRSLIEGGMAEKAVPALRSLLDAHSNHREARRLLGQARANTAQGRRARRNTAIVLATLLMLAVAALVKFQFDQEYERRLNEIYDVMDQAHVAADLLEAHFSTSNNPRVMELRAALLKRLRETEDEQAEIWLDLYREIQVECTMGDPMLGMERALNLPEPPDLRLIDEEWPVAEDLLSGLVGQLEEIVELWGPPTVEKPLAEQRLQRLVDELHGAARTVETDVDIEEFKKRLQGVRVALRLRGDEREARITEQEREERLEEQEILLARGRAYAQASDLDRSIEAYEEIFELDGHGRLVDVLAREYGAVVAQRDAVLKALELCRVGRHEEAVEILERSVPNPGAFLLPWKVETDPPGARVFFEGGTMRTAPFEMDSAVGERIAMRIELDGHVTYATEVDEPGDLWIALSREPDVTWRTDDVVDAPPVAVKEDYVLCDRGGRIACVSADGTVRWTHDLDTLGGIARAPVFLPRKPGWLVTLTEDGEAYLVDAENGQLQGPWNMESPPTWGPVATGSSVLAYFRSGATAEWETRLRPEIGTARETPADGDSRDGTAAGMRILRTGGDGPGELVSHSGDWTVTIEDDVYRVAGSDRETFHVRRAGDWYYLAWEAPRAGLLSGRLWISDNAGLRAFAP